MKWQQLQTETPTTIIEWASKQPWCVAMANCTQDASWHSEGDVWTHTKLVIDQLQSLLEWPTLSAHEQTVLLFTALFHDVAKPLTTTVDPETGRTISPKHSVKGEFVARGILRELGCDLKTREEITQMVRYHGRPVFLLEREEPTNEVIRLSWLLNNRLLYLFALADARGRDSDSADRPEENLQFLKLLAEEANCYTQPYQFAHDHARFSFFRQKTPNIHYTPYEKYIGNVKVMSGLPGAGKDTWLKNNHPDLPVVSLDDIRDELDAESTGNQGQVIQLAQERCREFLRKGEPFAFNATNVVKQTRDKWITLFNDYNARIEIVYVEPLFEKIIRQNKGRSTAVPEFVIHRLAEKCEPPSLIECHGLELII